MSPARDDRAWPGLAAGLAVSLLAHAGLAWLAVAGSGGGRASPPLAASEPVDSRPVPDEIELGMNESRHASITWLGVTEDPAPGAAREAEVDQAALTTAPGAERQPSPQPPGEPAPPAEEPAPPMPEAASSLPEPAPQTPAPAEPFELPAPPEPGPAVVPEPRPEAPPEPEPREEAAPPAPDPTPDVEPGAEMGPPRPQERAVVGPPAPPRAVPAPGVPGAPAPADAGDEGVLSDRESEAALRRTAIDVEMDELGRPLAGKGLEIKTVRPDWPAAVRNTHRPRNAVMVIRFGPDGKVKKAEFLREPDGRKGTGSWEVDGPLVDAVYRWTAKGLQVEALNKDDPDAEVVVSIRMLLTRPAPGG